MKRPCLVLVACLSAAFGREPTKDTDIIFQLISVSESSKLDDELLEKISEASSGEQMSGLISKLFKPIRGEEKIYVFRAAFWGGGKFRNTPQIFHDLLILSVNKEGAITDGFSHTEEWGEMPLFSDLQRVSVNGLKFSLLKSVSQLKLKPAIGGIGHSASFSIGMIDKKRCATDHRIRSAP